MSGRCWVPVSRAPVCHPVAEQIGESDEEWGGWEIQFNLINNKDWFGGHGSLWELKGLFNVLQEELDPHSSESAGPGQLSSSCGESPHWESWRESLRLGLWLPGAQKEEERNKCQWETASLHSPYTTSNVETPPKSTSCVHWDMGLRWHLSHPALLFGMLSSLFSFLLCE